MAIGKHYRRFWRVTLGYIPLGMIIERHNLVHVVFVQGLREYLAPVWPYLGKIIRFIGNSLD